MVWFPSKQHYFILKASAIWQISKVSVSVCIQCEHLVKAHTAHIHTHTQAPATNRASNISHLMEFLTQTFESFPFQFAQFPNGISPFNRKLNKNDSTALFPISKRRNHRCKKERCSELYLSNANI